MDFNEGISRCVKIFVRKNAEAEVENVIHYNLVGFCEWYGRAKERGAEIFPNGMTGMIVVTPDINGSGRYFDCEIM